jgi:toxin HigB-1
MIHRVEVTRFAYKQLDRAPKHTRAKLLAWVDAVESRGLEEVRKVPGFNDHPLKGALAGKRAVRLSQKWRAVYEVKRSAAGESYIEFVQVQEVHPHDY